MFRFVRYFFNSCRVLCVTPSHEDDNFFSMYSYKCTCVFVLFTVLPSTGISVCGRPTSHSDILGSWIKHRRKLDHANYRPAREQMQHNCTTALHFHSCQPVIIKMTEIFRQWTLLAQARLARTADTSHTFSRSSRQCFFTLAGQPSFRLHSDIHVKITR